MLLVEFDEVSKAILEPKFGILTITYKLFGSTGVRYYTSESVISSVRRALYRFKRDSLLSDGIFLTKEPVMLSNINSF